MLLQTDKKRCWDILCQIYSTVVDVMAALRPFGYVTLAHSRSSIPRRFVPTILQRLSDIGLHCRPYYQCRQWSYTINIVLPLGGYSSSHGTIPTHRTSKYCTTVRRLTLVPWYHTTTSDLPTWVTILAPILGRVWMPFRKRVDLLLRAQFPDRATYRLVGQTHSGYSVLGSYDNVRGIEARASKYRTWTFHRQTR